MSDYNGHRFYPTVDGDGCRCVWCDCREGGLAAERPCPQRPDHLIDRVVEADEGTRPCLWD